MRCGAGVFAATRLLWRLLIPHHTRSPLKSPPAAILARQGLPIQPRPLVIASREGFSVQLALSQRSHSPITKSREPRTATTSPIMWPGRIFVRMLRLTKLGDRIFRRYGTPPPLL